MPRESKKNKQLRALEIARRLDARYPQAQCALHYRDPFSFAIAVLLSAQTTDVAVNKISDELFSRWGTPEKMAQADPYEIEEVIHSIGFYRVKARNCIACAQRIVSEYGGEVPADIDELQTLPGVGRKTANVILNEIFGVSEGIAVDTHVFRIAHKLDLSKADTPTKTEQDLLALYPKELWGKINRQWVLFGREICIARRPKCTECPVCELCPGAQL
ncbi:MAG: endonuclease III [Actinobacteria bacterium]|nr:endonuclease III [Actinomycetota bacterium]